MAKIRIPAEPSVPASEIRLPFNLSKKGGVRLANVGLSAEAEAVQPAAEEAGKSVAGETIGVSDNAEHADAWLILFSYILVGVGLWLGNMLAAKASAVSFAPIDGISLLALFFIMAQALERLVEPLAELSIPGFGSSSNKAAANRDKKIQEAMATHDRAKKQKDANIGANEQAAFNKIKANTKVSIWAVATFVAMLISGATRLFFLDAVGAKGVSDLLNVLVTGLVVGSGTKPLHELIKLIEKKNEPHASDESGSSETANA